MKIVIVGAGSVGMLLSTFLAETMDVIVVVRRNEQLEAIRSHGLCRKNMDGTLTKKSVKVITSLEEIPTDSFVIVSVKTLQLEDLYSELKKLPEDTPILFVQNGLAHVEKARLLPQKTIAFGSCQFGAQKENDYTVIHRGVGVLKLAVERGNQEALRFFDEAKTPLFPVEFVDNAEGMLFEKALLNCFVNPLTTVLNVKNGGLVTNEYARKVLEGMYEELMEAFPEQREMISFYDVVSLCEKTATNTSSMLQDRLMNRKTEVDSIVGEVIKRAKQNGNNLPVLTTLYYLVLALEGEEM